MADQGIPMIPPNHVPHIGFPSLGWQQLVAGIALTDSLSAPEEHGTQQQSGPRPPASPHVFPLANPEVFTVS